MGNLSNFESSRIPSSHLQQQIDATGKADVEIAINGKKLTVPYGTSILNATRLVGVKIPTLCSHDDLCVVGVCRLCLVEVEGQKTLQAACAYPITASINIRTHTTKVRKARRHVLDLMLRNHYGECYACRRNHKCQLQDRAKEHGVDFFRFGHIKEKRFEEDLSSYAVVRDPDKCVLCYRCVRTCIDMQEVGVLEFINRGFETQVSTFMNKPLAEVICVNCGQCINRCPTGALRANDPSDKVWRAIEDPEKHVIMQTAPAPRACIGEEFGLEAGHSLTRELNTAIRMIGFDQVFDTNFAADLTIMEESAELLTRLKDALVEGKDIPLPMITSCSPGWVKFCEHFYPDQLDHLSTCKSPQQMFGALLKTYYAEKSGINPANIVTVALMPCSAKKFECNRPEMQDSGHKDVDYGLTTREMAQMIKECGIHLPDLDREDFDHPLGLGSGAGLIFGATGGVMEAAIRTAYEIVTGREVPFEGLNVTPVRGMEGIREASILIENPVEEWKFLAGVELKVAIAHGTANAKKIMELVKAGKADYHFIEIMACPGGCLGGGGAPIPTNDEIRRKRAEALYKEDASLEVRKSHENAEIDQIYEEFLGEPLGERSHRLLHTHYTPRGKRIGD
ncbi:MAG: iron hydrogenase small subunit [Candidatus Delongbacteria bacterium]|nr:iron hydrogenase small subunit [Candidatus Delongbacteria bacterium]